MPDLPFDITHIDAHEVQALEATYLLLRAKFKVSISADSTFSTKNFDVFYNVRPTDIGGTLLINHPESGCYLHFLRVPAQVNKGRGTARNQYKYQVWASATLRNDFGKMTVKRETIVDKVLDPVHPTQLYFKDDPAFSKKFNVVAGDKQKATRSMTKAFRNVVAELGKKDWEIEIVNSAMVIGSTQPIDPKQTVYLAEIAAKFSRVK